MEIIKNKNVAWSWFPMAATIVNISVSEDKDYEDNRQMLQCTVIPEDKADMEIDLLFRGVTRLEMHSSDMFKKVIKCVLLEFKYLDDEKPDKITLYFGDFKIDSIFAAAVSVEIIEMRRN
jgi:hypothetical protein